MQPANPNPPAAENSPEAEGRYHTYVTNKVPWLVHLLWLAFWILAISYVLVFQFPAIREEILKAP